MATGHIGVDESGKGDFFGPLVVAGCYVEPTWATKLTGVVDSKKVTDKNAVRLAEVIKELCPHYVLVIMPRRYNELYSEIKNLNRLLEWGHAKVIEEVQKIHHCELAISDQFADPRRLVQKLKLKGVDIELKSFVRAESDLAVAAASILARAEFLHRMDELSDESGMTLPKGASSMVITAGKNYVDTFGAENLGQVAKLHFKTTQQVLV